MSQESFQRSRKVRHEELESTIVATLHNQIPCVLLTLVETQGAVARKAGSRALLTPEGSIGTIGGGLFEARALEQAAYALENKQSLLFSYSGHDDTGRGSRKLAIEYLDPAAIDLFSFALDNLLEGKSCLWLLDLTDPEKPKRSLLLSEEVEDPSEYGTLFQSQKVEVDPQRLRHFLQRSGGKAQMLLDGQKTLYVEPFKIPPILLLCGAGHIAQETAELAAHCGFIVDVIDDRASFAVESRFPDARAVMHLPDFENLLASYPIGQRHYVVIMTHSHELDRFVLHEILQSHAFYIGMLGGISKRNVIFQDLREKGIPATELACVRTPIGLNIGAETPEEIAVSIVAELIAAKTGTLVSLRPQN